MRMRAFIRQTLPFMLIIIAFGVMAILPNVNWADDAPARDLNDDNVPDEVDRDPDPPGPVPGSITIVSGVDQSVLARISGVQNHDRFGHAASGIGDVNGDGLADLLVGAPDADGGRGIAYIFYGPQQRNGSNTFDASQADWVVRSPYADDYAFGERVAPLYDFDGDGLPDMRVRATVDVPNGETWYRTFIVSGLTGEILAGVFGPAGEFLWDALVGDLNNDGVVAADDIAELQARFGTTGELTVLEGDLNGDGAINSLDLLIADCNLGNDILSFESASAFHCDEVYSSGNCTYCVVYDPTMPNGIWKLATCVHCVGCDDIDGGGSGDIPLPPDTGNGSGSGSGDGDGDDNEPIETQPCVTLVPPGGEPPPGKPVYVCAGEEVCFEVQQMSGSIGDVSISFNPLECVSWRIDGTSVCFTLEPGCATTVRAEDDGCADEQEIVAVSVDLDIDSDNDNGLEMPERNEEEDAVEDSGTLVGKSVLVNSLDADGDGIPDYCDGFDHFSGAIDIDDTSEGGHSVPVALEISGFDAQAEVTVTISYSASSPFEISESLSQPFVLPAGLGRLWMKPVSEQRLSYSVKQGGDYVPPGSYSPQELGLEGADGSVVLYFEAVRRSTDVADIVVEVSVSLGGTIVCADRVRMTAGEVVLYSRQFGSSSFSNASGLISTRNDPDAGWPQVDTMTRGAYMTYRLCVRDPRAGLAQVEVGPHVIPLLEADGEYITPEFICLAGGETGYANIPNDLLVLSALMQYDCSYNPGWLWWALDFDVPADRDRYIADCVKQTVEEMENAGWIGDMDDPGAFGKEVHNRVEAMIHSDDDGRWLTRVYVANEGHPTEPFRRIVSVGSPPPGGVAHTTEIDVLRVKEGYAPQVGDILDPQQIDDLYEIKTSVGGKISTSQRDRLKAIRGGTIKVSMSPRRWTVEQSWHATPRFQNAIKILGLAGLASSAYAFINRADYDDELDVLVAKLKSASLQGDPLQRKLDCVELIDDVRRYLGHFDPTGNVDLIALAAIYDILGDDDW